MMENTDISKEELLKIMEDLRDSMVKYDRKVNQSNRELAKQREALEKQQEELEKQREVIKESVDKFEKSKKDYYSQLTKQVDDLTKRCKSLEVKIEDSTSDFDAAFRDIAELRSNAKELTDQCNMVRKALVSSMNVLMKIEAGDATEKTVIDYEDMDSIENLWDKYHMPGVPFLVYKDTWKNDYCLCVTEITGKRAMGIRFKDGEQYNTQWASSNNPSFYMYNGPSFDAIEKAMREMEEIEGSMEI